MSREKVAVVTGKDLCYLDDTDGANVLVKNFAEHVIKNEGLDVDIYTPCGYSGHQFVDLKAQSQSEENIEISPGITVKRFPVPRVVTPNYENQGLELLNRVNISMGEAVYFEDGKLFDYLRIHIIHMAHSFGLVLGDIVPIERTIVHPMMLGTEYKNFSEVSQSYIDIEKAVFRKQILVQTPSIAESETLISDYSVSPEKIIITPRGFNPEALTIRQRTLPPIQNRKVRILCANMVRPQKGQKYFIDFAKECKKNNLPVLISLVGVNGTSYSPAYNKYSREIFDEIEKENLWDSFDFLKPRSQQELDKIMLNSDVAFYPSVFETFGKSPLESMATGLPTIVCDDVPAFREFIKDEETGILTSRNSQAMVESLKRLLYKPSLYTDISKNGISKGAEFFWENVLSRMILDTNNKISDVLST
ncbi:hypothetical protein C0416_01150 [bacterium]|nr:hypothetical protein [bacterium]